VWDESAGLRTEADVDALTPIRTAEELEAAGVFDVTRILAREAGDRMPISFIAPTPFWSTYSLLGFQGMMMAMRERPRLFGYLMERRHHQRLEILKGFGRAGADVVWIEECLSSADLISPADYERFAFATARAFVADVNRLGLTTVFYYCGDVVPRLPWLRQLSMAALAVEESKKGFTVDIADVIAGVDGACAVFGNVNAIGVIHEGTPEVIKAEVCRQIRAGQKAKGFVLCQGSPFTLDTPPAKIDWFVRSAHQFTPFTSRSHS
jgi:uroporphyrinogen-III decarboxylase